MNSDNFVSGMLNFNPSAHQYKIDVHCDNCKNTLKEIPKGSIDLVITSPPYNLGKDYEQNLDLDEYLSWHEELIALLYNSLSETGSICWQTGNYVHKSEVYPLDIYFYPLLKSTGFKLRNRIIWHFGHGLHCTKRLSGRYETILWLTKTDQYKFNLDDIRIPSKYPSKKHFKGPKKGQLSGNPRGKNPSDYWQAIEDDFKLNLFDIPNVKSNHPEKTSHPCQFPVELVERCILAYTDVGDTVLDPFAGVGTTGIAAFKQDRNSILIENDLSYYEEILDRIKSFKEGRLKTREIGTKIHKPTLTDKASKVPKEWKIRNDYCG